MRTVLSLFRRLMWAPLLLALGSAFLSRGRTRIAGSLLHRAAELLPRSFRAHFALARLAKFEGDDEVLKTQMAICRVINPAKAIEANRALALSTLPGWNRRSDRWESHCAEAGYQDPWQPVVLPRPVSEKRSRGPSSVDPPRTVARSDRSATKDFSSDEERAAFRPLAPISREEVAAVDLDRLLKRLTQD